MLGISLKFNPKQSWEAHVAKHLDSLRLSMQEHNCDFYLVGSSDPHQNEYVPNCWQRRAALSGFTGSAGDALLGHDGAWLWTDGRYFLQADNELDKAHWHLMRAGIDDSLIDWLGQQNAPRVGVDPTTLSVALAKQLSTALEKNGGTLLALSDNLIDQHMTLPNKTHHPLTVYPINMSGKSVTDKLSAIRKRMQLEHADTFIVSALDELAWLTNTRGTDIPYNPVSIGFALVGLSRVDVFTDAPVSEKCHTHWQGTGIHLHPYDSFYTHIKKLTGTVWYDPTQTSWHTKQCLSTPSPITKPSPISLMKAVKNSVELTRMSEAHKADARALIRFMHWLETHWESGVTECSAAKRLAAFRLDNPLCRDLSFPSISGFGQNGAIIHYEANEQTDTSITDEAIYLLDSGGQYWGGTTDVTRCMHFGTPSDEERRHYTLVLKAHLALRHAVFAKGTTGYALDCVTRQALWREGFDFAHGTGHGVGAYLCVHEGPHTISPRHSTTPLYKGMIVTNEPGLYLEGKHGIRIENVMAVVTAHDKNPEHGLHRDVLAFIDLTLVPYEKSLINTQLLTTEERQQINDYHQQVDAQLSHSLSDEPNVLHWLKEKLTPLV